MVLREVDPGSLLSILTPLTTLSQRRRRQRTGLVSNKPPEDTLLLSSIQKTVDSTV